MNNLINAKNKLMFWVYVSRRLIKMLKVDWKQKLELILYDWTYNIWRNAIWALWL